MVHASRSASYPGTAIASSYDFGSIFRDDHGVPAGAQPVHPALPVRAARVSSPCQCNLDRSPAILATRMRGRLAGPGSPPTEDLSDGAHWYVAEWSQSSHVRALSRGCGASFPALCDTDSCKGGTGNHQSARRGDHRSHPSGQPCRHHSIPLSTRLATLVP